MRQQLDDQGWRLIHEPVPWGLLAWLVGIVLGLTWVPLTDVQAGVSLRPPTQPVDILGNLLLLAPVAAVLAATVGRGEPGGRGFFIAAGGAALLSVAIELVQLLIPGRYVELWDVILNATGAAGAAVLVFRLRRRGVSRGTMLAALGGGTFLLALGTLFGSGALSMRLLDMSMWDPTFVVAAGDEAIGGRPYRGRVTDARLCAGEPGERVCAEPGADFVTRDRVTDVAESSQRVDLSARVLSTSDDQRGPARIVTFSRDYVFRNATLGQLGTSVVLRVRTLLAGKNGAEVAFHLPDAVLTGEPTAVAASYSPKGIGIRADGLSRGSVASFPTGLLVGWRLLRPGPIEPVDLILAAIVSGVAVFLPIGLGLGWLSSPLWWLAMVASVGLAGGYLVGAQIMLGASIHLPHVGLAAALAAVGFALGRWDRRRLAAGMKISTSDRIQNR